MNSLKYLWLLLPFVIHGCKKNMHEEAEIRKKLNTALVKKVNYLALGDSYTKGESVPTAESFPFVLRDSLNKEAFIEVDGMDVIAQTGWTTSNLLNGMLSVPDGKTYDLVTLLIGVNNEYQGKAISGYTTEFTTCLQKAIIFAGNDTSRVIVISIPDYGYTPFGAGSKTYISARIDAFNKVNRTISESMHVTYIDITGISRSDLPGLVANDGLHPSGKQYKLWVNALYTAAKTKIQKY